MEIFSLSAMHIRMVHKKFNKFYGNRHIPFSQNSYCGKQLISTLKEVGNFLKAYLNCDIKIYCKDLLVARHA